MSNRRRLVGFHLELTNNTEQGDCKHIEKDVNYERLIVMAKRRKRNLEFKKSVCGQ
jgi:hypothetical protein